MRMFSILLFLLCSFCVTTNAGITTSNIPLNYNLQDIQYIATDSVQKSWWQFDIGILGFPLQEPPIDECINELLQKHGGDALINIRYFTQKSIFLFLTRNLFTLKADIVKINLNQPVPKKAK